MRKDRSRDSKSKSSLQEEESIKQIAKEIDVETFLSHIKNKPKANGKKKSASRSSSLKRQKINKLWENKYQASSKEDRSVSKPKDKAETQAKVTKDMFQNFYDKLTSNKEIEKVNDKSPSKKKEKRPISVSSKNIEVRKSSNQLNKSRKQLSERDLKLENSLKTHSKVLKEKEKQKNLKPSNVVVDMNDLLSKPASSKNQAKQEASKVNTVKTSQKVAIAKPVKNVENTKQKPKMKTSKEIFGEKASKSNLSRRSLNSTDFKSISSKNIVKREQSVKKSQSTSMRSISNGKRNKVKVDFTSLLENVKECNV